MRSLIAICTFYVGLMTLRAHADFMDGNTLAGLCESDVE
jgi:hypothetical protein